MTLAAEIPIKTKKPKRDAIKQARQDITFKPFVVGPEYRLECLRTVRAHERSRDILNLLATDALPSEMRLLIMQHFVRGRFDLIILDHTRNLRAIRCSTLGASTASQKLEPVFFEALLKSAPVKLDMSKGGVADALKHLSTLPYSVRNLVLHCCASMRCTWRVAWPTSPDFPAEVLALTRLLREFAAGIRVSGSITICCTLFVHCHASHRLIDDWKEQSWRTGPALDSDDVTVREVMEDLVSALHVLQVQGGKILIGRFENSRTGVRETWTARLGREESFEQVLRRAFEGK